MSLNHYKKHLLSLEFHYNWYVEFNRGRDHFEDESRAGRPRNAVTPANIEAVRQLINVNPHLSYQQIQNTL